MDNITDTPVLELKNVTLRYSSRKRLALKKFLLSKYEREKVAKQTNSSRSDALSDVSIKFYRGDIVGILGRNGSGKSTLCRVISGVLEPTEGEVISRLDIGFLLSLKSFFSKELSGIDNIYLTGALLGKTKQEIEEKIDDIIDFSELQDSINKPVETYSNGMLSRLAFSIATTYRSDILIIDEVLSVGDKYFKAKCKKRMESIIKDSQLIILVSHSDSDIKKMCNRAILLDKGKVILDGSVDEVLEYYT
ncbi:Teichoic acids export ATP-binding protein TagH [Phocoenobacter uteri]|uniref:Teichoic acids export ATP-binding protein TagH n=1 Tax=Phocoenobacter uteri TaxID=146806 RepID=A0A379CAX5_9PAST|nr:ABC transporter ATP-binding protein [Phocoenobacter uteri]MDG6881405.1 hypothetical protein [Phocoenobacter uteri]SUB59433.1 Teichoic acids export ATP-binding protein TagH [Phocoenobacter uteri]